MGKKKDKTNGTTAEHTSAHDGERTERARYTEALSVPLSEARVAELRQELSTVTVERVGKENDVAVLKEAIKGLRDRETSIVGKLDDGTEEADVEVVEWVLTSTKEVITERQDTLEIIARRGADSHDLQDDLPFDGGDGEEQHPNAEQESPGP